MTDSSESREEPPKKKINKIPVGVTLVQTFVEHKDWVGRLAWSPDGRLLATPSADKTVKIWDLANGRTIQDLPGVDNVVFGVAYDPTGRVIVSGGAYNTINVWDQGTHQYLGRLDGHSESVYGVAFDRSGNLVASASRDKTVKIWGVESRECVRTLEGHTDAVCGIAFDPSGDLLASAGFDNTVRIWNMHTGETVHVLTGHRAWVFSVAFNPIGRILASASRDSTVKLWDLNSGQCILSLEAHTGPVVCVAYSPDGRLIASKGDGSDNTVRLWRGDSGACVATIPVYAANNWPPGVAFHPTLPLIAAVGLEAKTPRYNCELPSESTTEQVVHIYSLDYEKLVEGVTSTGITYTSAKIVLVGDSGVGKTGLGWRLAHAEFREHASTHGQQFWVLDQLSTQRADNTRCEAVLWDLAGQPDYRLIHALFLDDADVALILFDPTDSREPLHGVEFWLNQLGVGSARQEGGGGGSANPGPGSVRPSSGRLGPVAILVAARADRGTATLTQDDLDAFCRQRGLCACLTTSAKDGYGVQELLARLREIIPWNEKPATVTTQTFKRIKDFVLELKESLSSAQILYSLHELRALLQQTDNAWRFSEVELLTAVGHLENHGYVKRLRTSSGEIRVLLAPDLLNNLAASYILEARRNAKGLGSLEEERLLSGGYTFPELTRCSPKEQSVLLDSAALLFLEHNICFRETSPLTATAYLVFPDLINLKRPLIEDAIRIDEAMSYTISGAVENVYASLVVLLGYTQTFTRTDQWRNHARYEVGHGSVCGFRLEAERDAELDFVLYYGTDVPEPIRTLFQSLFESFLARRNVTVFRYPPVVCKANHVLSRDVVREQIRSGGEHAFCPRCGGKVELPSIDKPIQLTLEAQADVESQRMVADRRTRFEQAVFRVQTYVKERGWRAPVCFMSYAWGVVEHERWVERQLASDLQKAGVDVVLDRWENAKLGASISRFVERIHASDWVIVIGTPLYLEKYQNRDPKHGYIVAAEFDLVANRMIGTELEKATVLPILLLGESTESFPPLLHGRVYGDFRDDRMYFARTFDLILSLYGIAPEDQAVADLRESMTGRETL